MPQIPLIESRVSASSASPGRTPSGARVNAQAFDTGDISSGLSNLGTAARSLGFAMAEKNREAEEKLKREQAQEQARQIDETVSVTAAGLDLTRDIISIQNEAPADGSGVYERTNETLRNRIDETADTLENPIARTEFRTRMYNKLPQYLAGAAQFEAERRVQSSTTAANEALSSLQNRVRATPELYDIVVEQGNDVIDTRPGLSEAQRAGLRRSWEQDAARRRFEGAIDKAQGPGALDRLKAELSSDKSPWRERMRPEDFDRTLDALAVKRTQLTAKADAEAKGLLSSVKERTNGLALVPQEELARLSSTARASGSAALALDVASVMRQQDIIRSEQALPPDALRARTQPAPALPEEAVKATADLAVLLGRQPTGSEIGLAAEYGPQNAAAVLNAASVRPDAKAGEVAPTLPANAAAKTVRQLYNEAAVGKGATQTQAQFEANQVRLKLLEKAERAVKEDPVSYAASMGLVPPVELDSEDNFRTRGAQAKAVAQFYNIPHSDLKPLTVEEARKFTNVIDTGSAQEKLDVMSQMQAMGPEVARAAYKQIGSTGRNASVFEYAADLTYTGNAGAAAANVVRGQSKLTENPDVKSLIGADEAAVANAFNSAVGQALADASPRARQQIADAALAHYVETYASRGGANRFSDDEYRKSLNAVLGGGQTPALGTVNGQTTVLPAGFDEGSVEQILRMMTLADWQAMSATGGIPAYSDGSPVDPDDLADYASLRALGNGMYRVVLGNGMYRVDLADGQYADSVDASGRAVPYVLRFDQNKARDILRGKTQPVANTDATNADTLTEQPRTAPIYVPGQPMLGQSFNESGMWEGKR